MESKKERAHANRTRPTNLHLQPQGGVRRCGDEVGGGLVDYRFLYLDKRFPTNDLPVEISDLDLDKFDKMFCLMEANFSGFPDSAREIPLPFTDGEFVNHTRDGRSEHGFVPTRQDKGLWTLHAAGRYSGKVSLLPEKPEPGRSRWCFKTVYAWRDVTKTKTTEVSTMAITDDQPISAGNLKAALDELMGGDISLM